jgi:hypothetical protein
MSNLAEDKTIPVTPPITKREIKQFAQIKTGDTTRFPPNIVASHLNTLTPVGIAIIIVAAEK